MLNALGICILLCLLVLLLLFIGAVTFVLHTLKRSDSVVYVMFSIRRVVFAFWPRVAFV